MTGRPINNRAWLFVLPVLAFVLFSSIIPVMTVVNYSIQDSMGVNNFFWNGDAWFRAFWIQAPKSARDSTGRCFVRSPSPSHAS
jgi:ABC-type sugar transport system permease subunit